MSKFTDTPMEEADRTAFADAYNGMCLAEDFEEYGKHAAVANELAARYSGPTLQFDETNWEDLQLVQICTAMGIPPEVFAGPLGLEIPEVTE